MSFWGTVSPVLGIVGYFWNGAEERGIECQSWIEVEAEVLLDLISLRTSRLALNMILGRLERNKQVLHAEAVS